MTHTNKHSTADDSSYAAAEAAVQDNRKGLIDDDVRQEKSNEKPMLALGQ